MSIYGALQEKIARREVVCGVVGMGYVGLPLAVEMAKSGLRVIGFEKSQYVVHTVRDGGSHIKDVAATHVAKLREQGLLEATLDMARLAECDVVSICVPSPPIWS